MWCLSCLPRLATSAQKEKSRQEEKGRSWEGACPKVKVGGRHQIMFCLASDELESVVGEENESKNRMERVGFGEQA